MVWARTNQNPVLLQGKGPINRHIIMWFHRHEDCFGQWLSVAGSNSYGAYVIHPMVLVLVLMAVGFIGLNPWLTALNAIVLTTLFSFGFAGLLRRFPVVARIL